MLGTQASGTQVEPFSLAINNDSGRVNVRHPAPLGMTVGVTHIMTELG